MTTLAVYGIGIMTLVELSNFNMVLTIIIIGNELELKSNMSLVKVNSFLSWNG